MDYRQDFSVTTMENVSRDVLRDSVTGNDFHVQTLSRDSVTPRVTDKGVYLYTPTCHATVTPAKVIYFLKNNRHKDKEY